MKKRVEKSKDINQFFNQKKIKIYTLIFAIIFFLFVCFTSDSPRLLGTKILFSCFFAIFSLFNLFNIKLWIKILISIIISPFLFLLFFAVFLIGGMALSSFMIFGGLEDACSIDSDCVPANEIHCLHRVCEGNCENRSIMPSYNKNSKIPENLDCSSIFGGTYYLPEKISCIEKKCVSS